MTYILVDLLKCFSYTKIVNGFGLALLSGREDI